MAPKQKRGEDTTKRLLDAALDVFAKGGHEAFTVHAVVAASGVSLGSLYHHFGNADGLAAALYARCMGALLDDLVASLEGVRGARAGVAALVQAYLRHTAAQPASARFVHASAYASFLPAHAATIAASKQDRIAAISAWLRPHVKAGRIVALPEPLIEMLVIGPVAETARRWLAGAPEIDLDEAARELPERIWQALRRAPRRRPPGLRQRARRKDR
ncbi:TetR/AcrR family transcriptional regulator [Polyangium jinanense]|uniref:TetR/AcrR family transcriptional regulator n=1 Tax=Polyangium jinanense TaxID=2829994 RepID=A0A9X4AS08_9BACT|nr:TetR/AcrR family transcriptional regulator [Polyangium jinanense]MDC3954018.1 TetR/AcrR family transcriptional regulator [Polyangium jinanense]MDC3982026.1 TetR/AcrR family transcriptional regulator [Polyangium jinanense]